MKGRGGGEAAPVLHAEQSSAAPALLRPWEWLGVQDVQGCFAQGLKVMGGGWGRGGGRVSPPCMELMCGERSRLRVGLGSEARSGGTGMGAAVGARSSSG